MAHVPGPGRSLSIALIRPASCLPLSAKNVVPEIPPLGLAYLAAALERAGHRVQIIDAFGEAPTQLTRAGDSYLINGLTADQIVERVPPGVDLIGVTCMYSHGWIEARRVIGRIARALPGVPIVAGGEHPNADHQRLLATTPEVLCCVLGEGEDTIVELAARLSEGASIHDVHGIAFRLANGDIQRTPPRRRIREIDDIAWPEWRTVPLANYLDAGLSSDPVTARTMPILASRGCPYRCTFCSSPQMFGTKWVARDPAQVLAEIRHYVEALGAEHFEFHDLTTIVRREWIVTFCRLLVESGLSITWSMPSGTRTEALDAEVLGWMRRSGCRGVAYAAESGSPPELSRIKKKIKLPEMLASMRAAIESGMITRCHLIFGLPDQTKADVARSLLFVTQLAWIGVHDLGCFAFAPYPGSELYERLVAEGRLDPSAPDFDEVLARNVFTSYEVNRSFTPNLPPWSVPALCLGTMAYFYGLQHALRPRRVVDAVRAIASGRPATHLHRFIAKKLGVKLATSRKTAPERGSAPPRTIAGERRDAASIGIS